MITPISGNSPVVMPQSGAQSVAAKATPASPQSSQDTITLSSAAQHAAKASVDVDHDGDSH